MTTTKQVAVSVLFLLAGNISLPAMAAEDVTHCERAAKRGPAEKSNMWLMQARAQVLTERRGCLYVWNPSSSIVVYCNIAKEWEGKMEKGDTVVYDIKGRECRVHKVIKKNSN